FYFFRAWRVFLAVLCVALFVPRLTLCPVFLVARLVERPASLTSLLTLWSWSDDWVFGNAIPTKPNNNTSTERVFLLKPIGLLQTVVRRPVMRFTISTMAAITRSK